MTVPGAELRLERTFAARPERVFAAWTDPEVLRRWWAAGPDWSSPWVEVDLRVGGRYRLAMQPPDTTDPRVVSGEYIEVEPPRRLVYTWRWESSATSPDDATTVVTVEFHEHGPDATRVVLTHTGFPRATDAAAHEQGWQACLANLEARVLASV